MPPISPLLAILPLALAGAAQAQTLTHQAALGDWRADAPGVTRRITAADMPPPGQTPAAARPPAVVARPAGAQLQVPPGFTVQAFAVLEGPRQIRAAPNGDMFVAESDQGRIRVLRITDGAAAPADTETFASGLDRPFGIAFYPPGPDPKWVYVANTNAIVRFPYRSGDLKARGPAETIVPKLTLSRQGHYTRDIAFSADGQHMFVSIGSGSNAAETLSKTPPGAPGAFEAAHALGAAWGDETGRADVLVMDPEGKGQRVFAAGIRNCVTLLSAPSSDDLWCAVNERDALGDDLPPDYVTRVRAGGFYGWPWYYIGDHQDPRHAGERPDLAAKVTLPDVLLQPHSAPLGMVFYEAGSGAAAFPPAYRGDAFVALHGSWDRAMRTGYKIVRLPLRNGVPTGDYQDFLTGFVVDENSVWGRPVGVAVAHDGALLFTDDAGNTVWRVAYGPPTGAHP